VKNLTANLSARAPHRKLISNGLSNGEQWLGPVMIERDVAESANVHTVLVVEDEIILRFVACEFLRDAGFVVVEAVSGDEALRYIRAHPDIDVVFSDVRMPGKLDGLALYRQLAVEFPDLRVVMASGDAVPGPDTKVPFFRKPYDLDEVVMTIRRQLDIVPAVKGAANDL
jgi:two-component system, response regulator PdtaR